MDNYNLFIDESGTHTLKDLQSKYYVLCGVSIKQRNQEQLKNHADQIKFKYWNRTDVVFHSQEIAKNAGVFSIFKDKNLKEAFHKDLLSFLKKSSIIVFPVIVDKQLAKAAGWNDNKVIKETARYLFYNFLCFLIDQRKKGKVIVESATSEKDVYYLKAFSYFLAPNNPELTVNYTVVQNLLTSISFVTKHNNDIEEQISDLFSYAVKCEYVSRTKEKTFNNKSYENSIMKVLNTKLFKLNNNMNRQKKKNLLKIESFCVLPKSKKTSSS